MQRLLLCLVITLAGFLVTNQNLQARGNFVEEGQPTLLYADSLKSEHDIGLVIARGSVKIFQGETVLIADVVTFNQQSNIVTASGNIKLMVPDGEVIFADYIELSGDLKWGTIKQIRMLMSDDAKFAASIGRKIDKNEMELERAVYSPCQVCREAPDRPPVWQLKSRTVLWDREKQDIIHTDSVMEMFGVPVFYTPYLRHPDPKVKHRTGLLTPTFGVSKDHGYLLRVPYYVVISTDKDITLSPLLSTDGGIFLGAKYRQRYSRGLLKLAGSYGQASGQEKPTFFERTGIQRERHVDHWHIDHALRYNFSQNWRLKADVVRTGSQTYLRQYPYYGYSNENILTTVGSVEGFFDRSYVEVQAMSFQGLRATDLQSRTPFVAPFVNYNFVSRPRQFGHRWFLDMNGMSLHRHHGTEVQRLSTTGGLQIPFSSPLGDVYTLGTSVRGDLYHIDDFRPTLLPCRDKISGLRGRGFPQASLDWRLPFVNSVMNGHTIIEPEIKVMVSPNVGDQGKIPNEDSFLLEPRDHSLLNESRFLGLDRIDDGSRVDYGIKLDASAYGLAQANLFFGQTYSFHQPAAVLKNTGFDKRWSDYIARLGIAASRYFDLYYGLRLDRSDFSLQRSELTMVAGDDPLRARIDYLKLPSFPGDNELSPSQQIDVSLSSEFTKGWTVQIGTIREVGNDSGPLAHRGGLTYKDECFQFSTIVTKSFYKDRELKPDTSIMFALIFVNLGQVRHEQALSRPQRIISDDPFKRDMLRDSPIKTHLQ